MDPVDLAYEKAYQSAKYDYTTNPDNVNFIKVLSIQKSVLSVQLLGNQASNSMYSSGMVSKILSKYPSAKIRKDWKEIERNVKKRLDFNILKKPIESINPINTINTINPINWIIPNEFCVSSMQKPPGCDIYIDLLTNSKSCGKIIEFGVLVDKKYDSGTLNDVCLVGMMVLKSLGLGKKVCVSCHSGWVDLKSLRVSF